MRGLTRFLLRREVALIAFLLLKLAAVTTAGLATDETRTWGLGILALVTYTVIAWFAWRGRVLSIWAITILMLYEASGALITGLEQFNSAPAIGVIGIVTAAYLVMGALMIFASRHARR